MLILSSTTDLIQVITGGAGTIDVHASWMDNNAGTVIPGRTNTAITTATTTTVVPSPAAATQRNLKTLHIANRGGSAIDITVQHTDGSTVSQLHKVSLAGNVTLQYVDEIGFVATAGATPVVTAAFSPASNLVINSGIEVSQESLLTAVTGITAVNRYVPDMFGVDVKGAVVVTGQVVADAPTGFTNSFKVSVTTADTSVVATDKALIYTVVEGYRCNRLAFGTASAQSVALSFYVKANRTGTYSGSIENFDVNRTWPFNFTVNSTGVWEYKTQIIPGDVTGTWHKDNAAGLYINWMMMAGTNFTGTANTWNAARAEGVNGTINGVAATSDYMQITGVGLIPGTVAVANGAVTMRNFDEEFQLSRRYYRKSFDYETKPAQNAGNNTGEYFFPVIVGQPRAGNVLWGLGMRTAPVTTLYNPAAANAQIRNVTSAVDCTGSAGTGMQSGILITAATPGAGANSGDRLAVHYTADARL